MKAAIASRLAQRLAIAAIIAGTSVLGPLAVANAEWDAAEFANCLSGWDIRTVDDLNMAEDVCCYIAGGNVVGNHHCDTSGQAQSNEGNVPPPTKPGTTVPQVPEPGRSPDQGKSPKPGVPPVTQAPASAVK